MPQHLYRVSTNECFHYPEVFFVPESIKMACNKISEKKIINENPSEGTATDISISFDLTEYGNLSLCLSLSLSLSEL